MKLGSIESLKLASLTNYELILIIRELEGENLRLNNLLTEEICFSIVDNIIYFKTMLVKTFLNHTEAYDCSKNNRQMLIDIVKGAK